MDDDYLDLYLDYSEMLQEAREENAKLRELVADMADRMRELGVDIYDELKERI